MTTARLLMVGVVGAALVALCVRATAQIALPDGPNRELVSRTCGACHGADAAGRTGSEQSTP